MNYVQCMKPFGVIVVHIINVNMDLIYLHKDLCKH